MGQKYSVRHQRLSMVYVRIVVVMIVMHLICSIIGKIIYDLLEIYEIHKTSLLYIRIIMIML